MAFQYETLKLPYTLEKVYTPDFIIPKKGRKIDLSDPTTFIVVEAKGVLDPSSRTKMRAVKRDHPELDIRMLFMDASKKLSKKAKMNYGRWADLNGFEWADGHAIPKEWFK